ncbi:amino acid permease [Terrilactibacillus sp. S3-3]|nr:amino acid permease [Terrilactibacillus sp. S3-3]
MRFLFFRISILTGAITLYGFGFNQGGAAVMGIGWPLVTLFVLFVSASMAELTSAIPTSGAIYHWASILGGPRWGWFTGWFNMIGQVTVVAGIDFGCAGFASSLLFGHPDKSQLLICYGVILASHALLNHVGIKNCIEIEFCFGHLSFAGRCDYHRRLDIFWPVSKRKLLI